MKKGIGLLVVLIVMMGNIYADTVTDVSKTDPAYQAVQQSVKLGYLSVFNDGEFLPTQNVSRKEMAVILDKIIQQYDTGLVQLSRAELQELAKLSRSFKAYLTKQDTSAVKFKDRMVAVEDEQRVIHHDLTALSDQVQVVDRKNQDQTTLIWVGIALGVLGALK